MSMAVLSFDLTFPWGDVKYSLKPLNGIRTYDGIGGCFTFLPFDDNEWKYAIDAEPKCLPFPKYIHMTFGMRSPKLWNHIEIIAKLSDIPSYLIFKCVKKERLDFLKEYYEIEFYDCDTEDHWITIGRCRKQIKRTLAPCFY